MVDYGDVARTAKEWQKAEKRYKTAISIAEKYQRKITIVEASIGLSEVLQHLGKHTESLKLKNTAKKICEEIDIDYLFVEQRMRNI